MWSVFLLWVIVFDQIAVAMYAQRTAVFYGNAGFGDGGGRCREELVTSAEREKKEDD